MRPSPKRYLKDQELTDAARREKRRLDEIHLTG